MMKARILIAEDSAHMRMILKEMLLRHGYQVAGEAENGKEAVEQYDRLKPDIVTLDLSLPEMSGIEALKAIKAKHPKAKVVMISALGQETQVIDAMRAGADEFFIKPLQAQRVVEALEAVM